MAKVKLNALVESARGRLGNDLVLKRTRSGATILAKKPEFPKDRKFTARHSVNTSSASDKPWLTPRPHRRIRSMWHW
jgi:hypothetical protein